MEEIIQLDNLIRYSQTVDAIDFLSEFFDGVFNHQNEEKLTLLRHNFAGFWQELDIEKKKKYVNLVKKYCKNKNLK